MEFRGVLFLASDVGYVDFGEAEIVIEDVGHDPHGDIAQAVHRDKGENQQRELAVAAKKLAEGAGDRTVEPADEVPLPFGEMAAAGHESHHLLVLQYRARLPA